VKLREIESWGVKLRVFEDQMGYFKMTGSSGGLVKFPLTFLFGIVFGWDPQLKSNVYLT
jgi:hypothetical protein